MYCISNILFTAVYGNDEFNILSLAFRAIAELCKCLISIAYNLSMFILMTTKSKMSA